MHLTVDASASALLPRLLSSLTALATASRPEAERLSTFVLTATSTAVPPKIGRYVGGARNNLLLLLSVKECDSNNESDGGVRVTIDGSLLELDVDLVSYEEFALVAKRLRGPRRL